MFVPLGAIRGACLNGRICEQQFRIKPGGTTVTAPADGEFCAYANDLMFMYGNNKGQLSLTVTRVN